LTKEFLEPRLRLPEGRAKIAVTIPNKVALLFFNIEDLKAGRGLKTFGIRRLHVLNLDTLRSGLENPLNVSTLRLKHTIV
jgi:hypothetical protein